MQEDHRTFRRSYLGRLRSGEGLDLSIYSGRSGKHSVRSGKRGTMSYVASGQAVEILLVEDNPGDVELTLRSFAENRVRNRVSVVSDGEEALLFLRRQNQHSQAPRPDIIFLDLNLPKKDGREVLTEIKADPTLMDIPVVVLTSSDAERDVLATYRLQANCFVTKPVDLAQFMNAMSAIESFWLTVVKLPK